MYVYMNLTKRPTFKTAETKSVKTIYNYINQKDEKEKE